MITLPNGDKWIIDDRELVKQEDVPYGLQRGSETTLQAFLHDLIYGDNRLPRKLIFSVTFPDGYWDCNHDPYREVLGAFALNTNNTPFFDAYEMTDGKVFVVYNGNEFTEVVEYPSRVEYHQAVTFEE